MSDYLVADIGGTNARFGLVTAEGGEVFGVETIKASEAGSLTAAAQNYLKKAQCIRPPTHACFGVASPVSGDQVKLTNSPWQFSISELENQLGLQKLLVVNDFAAVAASILQLNTSDYISIGETPKVEENGPRAILGPGTGLGMATLVPYHDSFVPVPTEGGHAQFCPSTDLEKDIKDFLLRSHDFVSNEMILSGRGLLKLMAALKAINGESDDTSPDISDFKERYASGNKLVKECLNLFFDILGSVAGDYALQTGSRSGVFVAGGIAPRYIEEIKSSNFRERFVSKGRFRSYLEAIPTSVIVAAQPGLLGAAAIIDLEGENP